jgi:hypothetical protein
MSLQLLRKIPESAPNFLEPPFRSLGLKLRYLPLRANLEQLTSFIDEYINLSGSVPEEVGRFRPYMPSVSLVIAEHPHLESDGTKTWVSQQEIAFMVPVTWHRRVAGRWQFEGFAWVQPFIYLDSPLGLTTGRQVWGWDKALANFPTWADKWEGSGDAELMHMLMELPASMTEPATRTNLIEVNRVSASKNPMKQWAKSWSTLMRQSQDFLKQMSSPGAMRDLRLSVMNGRNFSLEAWQSAMSFPPVVESVVPTLQQFRAVGDQQAVSYQALVTSSMRFDRFIKGGMLGLPRMMMGDLSGGLQVRLRYDDSQPIIAKLGLEPDRTETLGDATFGEFTPLCPYEITADVSYGAGDVQCWRRHSTPWMKPLSSPDAEPEKFEGAEAPSSANFYSVAIGEAATQAKFGPFDFRAVRASVFRLAADAGRLNQIIHDWVGPTVPGAQLELVTAPKLADEDAWVELVITRQHDDMGRIFVSFRIPVLVTEAGQEQGSIGYVAPFEYSNRGVSSITGEEVEGRRVFAAQITERGGLVEVNSQFAKVPLAGAQSTTNRVAAVKIRAVEDGRGIERADLRESFDGPYVGVNQFPHAAFTSYACVQEVVATPFSVSDIRDVELASATIELPSYASQSLIQLLGLRHEGDIVTSLAGVNATIHLASTPGHLLSDRTEDG